MLDQPAIVLGPSGGQLGDRRRVVAFEPGCLELAAGHLASHYDLESPLAELKGRHSGKLGVQKFAVRLCVFAALCEILFDQSVKAVALPVQFFLQRDHLPPGRRLTHVSHLHGETSDGAELHDVRRKECTRDVANPSRRPASFRGRAVGSGNRSIFVALNAKKSSNAFVR